MTLDLKGLKNNMAELCSAAQTGNLTPSATGKSIYNANRGAGLIYSYFYTLCSFSGKAPPVKPLLKESLKYTQDQYKQALEIARIWVEKRAQHKKTNESELEVVVFLASFHKSCKKEGLLIKLQALFQSNACLPFHLIDIPHLDFHRRVDVFERTTGSPFPFELVKKAILQNGAGEMKPMFLDYENAILETVLFLSEEEKNERRARIVDKLVKILKDLGTFLMVDQLECYAIWGRMGCHRLLTSVSKKRKATLSALKEIRFEGIPYFIEKRPSFDFERSWTRLPLAGTTKEAIVFHSVLNGALLSREREEKEIIPITPSKKYNAHMGLLLKKGHCLAWIDAPLEEYEKELMALINHLVSMNCLPVDPMTQLMEIEAYGFDKENQLTVKLNYTEVPYHILIVHDFLFKACKKNAKDYIRLARALNLEKAPMGQKVGSAFLGHFSKDERRVKISAGISGATEHDYHTYWVKPFALIEKFLKESDSERKRKVQENYLRSALGCYPFEGVLEALSEELI
ncbi:MAG: hypothetical protein ACK4HV_00055 [Parachlamydiaceae bacterium]